MKHLEMIQAVITRLSNEGFLIKGWAITVASALFGFAIDSWNWPLALVAVGSSLAFWTLDASFLRSERLFRALYAQVRKGAAVVDAFSMDATSKGFLTHAKTDPGGGVTSRWNAFRRPTLLLLYGTIIVVAAALAIVIASGEDPRRRAQGSRRLQRARRPSFRL